MRSMMASVIQKHGPADLNSGITSPAWGAKLQSLGEGWMEAHSLSVSKGRRKQPLMIISLFLAGQGLSDT